MNRPLLFGPCAKRRTQAVLIDRNGLVHVAENVCLNPQEVCPREEGEDYKKCHTICRQVGHAEQQVIAQAGPDARGGTLMLTHWYACDICLRLCEIAGIKNIEYLGPQDTERTP